MAINVLRFPPVTVFPKTTRSRNAGAESDTPMLASAMLPDLRKYLRFMIQLFLDLFPAKAPREFTGSYSLFAPFAPLREENLLPLKLRRSQN